MLSVCTALSVCATFVVLVLCADQSHFAYFFERISRIRGLDAYWTTSRALALAASNPERPGLVLLGASTTRESFDEQLARTLMRDLGGGTVIDLTASGESIVEAVGLADSVPDGFRGVVVFGINCLRLSSEADLENLRFPRFGNYSASFKDEAARRGVAIRPDIGIYAIDHYPFLTRMWGDVRRKLRRLLRDLPDKPPRHLYRDRRPLSEAALLRRMQRTAAAIIARSSTNYGNNFEILTRFVQRMQSRNITVAFLESPINPRFIQEGIGVAEYQRYQHAMRRFAADMNVEYLDFNAAAQLLADDFYDGAHLRNRSSSERLTKLLVAHFRNALSGEKP